MIEQRVADRRIELRRKAGLTKEEQEELRTCEDIFWVTDVKVGTVGVFRFVAVNHMRVEVLVIGDTLKISFDDHYDDGSSHAVLSTEQMDKIIEFYQAVRNR